VRSLGRISHLLIDRLCMGSIYNATRFKMCRNAVPLAGVMHSNCRDELIRLMRELVAMVPGCEGVRERLEIGARYSVPPGTE